MQARSGRSLLRYNVCLAGKSNGSQNYIVLLYSVYLESRPSDVRLLNYKLSADQCRANTISNDSQPLPNYLDNFAE